MLDKFKSLVEQGKPFLKQYLEEMGIEIVKKGQNEFFSCINPLHEDKNPSCGLIKHLDNSQFHCFSCLNSGDIYTAAHILEGKPLYGMGFVKDNLEYILNKFEVEFEETEFTEEQLTRFKYEQVYNIVYDTMVKVDPSTGNFIYLDTSHAAARGWGDPICKEIGIGSIKDFDEFIKQISKQTSIPEHNLKQMGIRNDLFGPDLLTFTVRDEYHVVKGFATRYVNWTNTSSEPKYKNTSLEDNPYYRKDRLLFCLDKAKSMRGLRLDIFEGYGSAVTAHQAGYRNCCAIGGTALTEKHIEIVRNLGFQHINLVMDADSTGESKMEHYIDKFSGYNGLEVTITHLPLTIEELSEYGKNDPDYFINKNGIDKYRELKPVNLFTHMLQKNSSFTEGDPLAPKFCKRMLPLIINQPDNIIRGQMIASLSKHTYVDKEDIKAEIDRLEKSDIELLKGNLLKEVRNVKDPDQLQTLLSNSMHKLGDSSSTKQDRYLMSLGETIEVFDNIYLEMNTLPEGIHGWRTGFSALDELLDGIPKPGKNGGRAVGFAGAPQAGKSAAMLNVALNVALKNDDVSILYWAIDDHRKAIAYRLISMISGLPMKKILNTQKRTDEDDLLIRQAQDSLRQLMTEQRLVFKDDKFGRSKNKAEAWIKSIQDSSGKDILFCVDSLHNVKGDSGQELRVKVLTASTWLKSLTAGVPCTVMATIELVKNRTLGKKPTLQEISETGKIEFDFDTVGIVWNEAQGQYTDVSMVKAKWGSPGNWKPIIEIDFQKNKAGAGEKGSVYFQYDSSTTKFLDSSRKISDLKSMESDTIELTSDTGIVYSAPPSISVRQNPYKTESVDSKQGGKPW